MANELKLKEVKYFPERYKSEPHTLTEAITRYVENVLPNKQKGGKKQARQLQFWQGELGAYHIHNITPALISQVRDKLLRGKTTRGNKRSPSTVNRYMSALSHLFSVAYKEWGWVQDNPFRKLSKLREPRGIVRYLSDEERGRLLVACKESRNRLLYPITVLCLLTGARKMGINALRWKQVDLVRRKLILTETKNGDIRALPLSQAAYEILANLPNAGTSAPESYVFPSPRNPDRPIEITNAFKCALDRAGIDSFRFHDLRHSAASYLAMNGASLAEIAEVLGHKTLNMVKRYAHLSESHTAKVVEAMNRKIFNNSNSVSSPN